MHLEIIAASGSADIEDVPRLEAHESESLSRAILHLHTFVRNGNRGQGIGVTFLGLRVSYFHLVELFSGVMSIMFLASENIEAAARFNNGFIAGQSESEVTGELEL